MPRLRIGLIGCGRIAQRFHLPVLAALDGVDLVAIAETETRHWPSCRRVAPRVRLVGDYRELLEQSDVDAIVICLPPSLHADAALAAFQRGLHVYLEKPIATTIEDANRVVMAWRATGTVGRIGFCFRCHPLLQELCQALRQGRLGEVVGARTSFCAARRDLPEWKRERRSGGGALLDLASHHFDLVRFLFEQEIVEVGALLRSVESEDDTAVVELRLEDGPLVTTLISLAAVEEDRVEVLGSLGRLTFDRYRSSRLHFLPARRDFRAIARLREAGAAMTSWRRLVWDAVSPPQEQSFARALAAFAGAARGGVAGGPDLEDGLRSLRVVLAAEHAALTGQTVRL